MRELATKIFAVSEEDVNSVRQYYKKTQEEIDRDCEIIKEWMKQQSHFPDDYDKTRVERLLMRNKFRVERTKMKLENYYTLKTEHKTFLENMDPRKGIVQSVFTTVWTAPLPKLVNGTDRVYVYRVGQNEHLFSLEPNVLLLQALLEIELLYDYAVGVRFIFDYENLTLAHLKRADLSILTKSFYLYQECRSGRILTLEFINHHSLLNMVMGLFKLCVPEKVYNKIIIHKDMESLHKSIPVEYLPKEYGGKLGSLYDIHEDVKELYLKSGDFLMQRLEVVADESKRVGEVKRNEHFGVDGTFKKINLD